MVIIEEYINLNGKNKKYQTENIIIEQLNAFQ